MIKLIFLLKSHTSRSRGFHNSLCIFLMHILFQFIFFLWWSWQWKRLIWHRYCTWNIKINAFTTISLVMMVISILCSFYFIMAFPFIVLVRCSSNLLLVAMNTLMGVNHMFWSFNQRINIRQLFCQGLDKISSGLRVVTENLFVIKEIFLMIRLHMQIQRTIININM